MLYDRTDEYPAITLKIIETATLSFGPQNPLTFYLFVIFSFLCSKSQGHSSDVPNLKVLSAKNTDLLIFQG